MARSVGESRPFLDTVVTVANTTSWYCALLLLVILFVSSLSQENGSFEVETVRGDKLMARPCDEIYVVGEGETLHTISDKCGDPFIVERNPHIHDPDDVFPGLVIKITPSNPFKR